MRTTLLLLSTLWASAASAQTLSLSDFRSCAVTRTGEVRCWGSAWRGMLGSGESRVYINFVGSDTLQLPGRVPLPDGVRARRVSVGGTMACLLSDDGAVYCWGSSYSGYGLGLSGVETLASPHAPVPLPHGAVDVAAGYDGGCAVLTSGETWCWGPVLGQAQAVPYRINNLPSSVALALSQGIVCTRTSEGQIWCMGGPSDLRRGPDATTEGPVRVPLPEDAAAEELAVGESIACARTTTGRVACWGYRYDNRAAAWLPEPSGVTALAVSGGRQVCTTGQEAFIDCWKLTSYYTAEGYHYRWNRERAPLPEGKHAQEVDIFRQGGCAPLVEGGISCWGSNYWAHLARFPERMDTLTYRPVQQQGRRFLHLVAPWSYDAPYLCATTDTADLRCWGTGVPDVRSPQEPGIGDFYLPTRMSRSDSMVVRGAASGREQTCVFGTEPTVYCGGGNRLGEAGLPTTDLLQPFRSVAFGDAFLDADVRSMAAGAGSSCALFTNGRAYCWGWAGAQLGASLTGTGPSAPVQVSLPADVRLDTLYAGFGLYYARATNGKLWYWGDDGYSYTDSEGNYTYVGGPVPPRLVALPEGVTVVSAAGDIHAFCLASTAGQVFCRTPGRPFEAQTLPSDAHAERVWLAQGFLFVRTQAGTLYRISIQPYRSRLSRTVVLPSGRPLAEVAGGALFHCLLDDAGQAFCQNEAPSQGTVVGDGSLGSAVPEAPFGVDVFSSATEPGANGPEAVFTVGPNPAARGGLLTIRLDAPGELRATLYDVLGRVRARFVRPSDASMGTLRLPIEAGVYLLQIDGAVRTSRVIVVQ